MKWKREKCQWNRNLYSKAEIEKKQTENSYIKLLHADGCLLLEVYRLHRYVAIEILKYFNDIMQQVYMIRKKIHFFHFIGTWEDERNQMTFYVILRLEAFNFELWDSRSSTFFISPSAQKFIYCSLWRQLFFK